MQTGLWTMIHGQCQAVVDLLTDMVQLTQGLRPERLRVVVHQVARRTC